MNQLFKKGTALTLTLVLLLSLLPLSALAADGDPCTVMADCTGTYENGLCNVCGQPAPADEPPADDDGGDASPTPPHTHVYDGTPTYAPKDDAFHTVTRPCTTCAEQPTETLDEGHTYVDGVCACGKEEPTHTHVYDGTPTYAPKDDAFHTVTRPCTTCAEQPTETLDEGHTYVDGVCACGKAEPPADDAGDDAPVPPAPVDEALEAVKAQLEALPTLEELSTMTRDEKIALHDTAYLPAGNAYNALTEEQKAQVDATKLMALGAYFADPGNLQTIPEEPATSGKTGACDWTFDENTGTLTISGTGTMGSGSEQWDSYKDQISTVVIESGVTSIGNNAFCDYTSLTTVTIPGSVISIGSNAFYKCTSLTTVKYGGTTAPTASNNVFSGTYLLFVSVPWNYELEASIPIFCGIMAKREDKPTTYTVTFDMQNHGTAIEQQTITSGGKVTEPTVPTAEGYTFGGWYTDSACTTGKEWNFDTEVTESTTLYAKWTEDTSGGGESGDTTYTVTFVDGEGSGTMDAVTVNSGAEYTLPACTFTAPSGKEFKAWSVGGAEKAVGDTITVSTDTTVTALWKDAAPTTYTITIPTINYGNVTTNKETAAAGDTVTLTVEPAVGYGLNTITANNGAVALTQDTTDLTKYTFTMPESNVTVTADFIPISVTIKSGNTDVTDQVIQLHAGKTVQLTEAVTPANASYNNVVWGSKTYSVATVDPYGNVTAVNEGTAVITVQVGNVSASCKVKVDAHDWEYTVDESQRNTVKVSCTVDGCGLNGAVSISADGGTYNGQPYNAELSYPDDWLKSVVNNISYEYRRNETEFFLFTTDTTKAGFYRANICQASSNNLHGAKTGAYVEYIVSPKALVADGVILGSDTLTYNGAEQKPTVTVKDGEKTLTGNTDYTIAYKQNGESAAPAAAGTYDVVITGKNNYTGTVTKSFTINKRSLADADVTLSDTVVFGDNVPTVTVKLDGNTLGKDDYTAEPVTEDGIEVTMVVKGEGNYTGEATQKPTYLMVTLPDPKDVEPDNVKAIEAYEAYAKYNETYQHSVLKEKLEALKKALTDYEIIKGHKSTYVKGSYKNLTLTANGYHGKFTGIEVDGELLHPTHYSVEKGSTVITLKYAYLESLKSGKHYVQMNYTDGSTDGDDYFRIAINNGSPITADGSHIHGFALLGLATMLLMCFILALKTRKKGRFER